MSALTTALGAMKTTAECFSSAGPDVIDSDGMMVEVDGDTERGMCRDGRETASPVVAEQTVDSGQLLTLVPEDVQFAHIPKVPEDQTTSHTDCHELNEVFPQRRDINLEQIPSEIVQPDEILETSLTPPLADETIQISSPPPDCPELIKALYKVATSSKPDVAILETVISSTSPTFCDEVRNAYHYRLIPLTMECMLRSPHNRDATIIALCAHILCVASQVIPEAPSEIGLAKGVQLLVHSMLIHKCSANMQIVACEALTALCTHPENRVAAGEFFAIELCTAASRNFANDVNVQSAVMRTLDTVTNETPLNVKICHKKGGARVPLRVLKRGKKMEQLVPTACEILLRMIERADEGSRLAIARLQPTKVLVAICVVFPQMADVQSRIARILGLLGEVDSMVMLQYGMFHGADIAVRNLRRHRGVSCLQLGCMRLLLRLCEMGMGNFVIAAGGLKAGITSMIQMRSDVEVQHLGLSLMERFIAISDEVFNRVLRGGGAEALLEALKAHILQEDFVDRGVKLMRVLRQ